ncbi:MAG: hypothetical protein A3F11_03215 [Gammaproteobacteria bacterium RIFCSPHIGHO2_12_FULL_37_14]|nr:MAG: hypothetical protein A3F11_03215 [Gammaproteobacteria bacterium RIFCSPHIGHO2_12_FULL_37_14]
MKKITLLTKWAEDASVLGGDLGLLVECSTDSKLSSSFRDAFPIEQLIGNKADTRRLACHMANRLLAEEPFFRGVPQLTIFQEVVSLELHKTFHLIQLHDFLLRNGYKACEFIFPSWWGDELDKLTKFTGSSLRVIIPGHAKPSLWRKLLNHIDFRHFSISEAHHFLRLVIDRIDPFHRRLMLFKNSIHNKVVKNRLWFYTTAVNYTNISLLYAEYFPESLQYLVENRQTGGKPLRKGQHIFTNLYDFSSPKFIPSRSEVSNVANKIYHYLLSVPLNDSERLARTIFMSGNWLEMFFSRLLSRGLYCSSIFENWITITKPTALIVGNAGYEAYALYKARYHNVSTIMLQHGVVADYDRHLDFPVDHFIVRGKFFYERLSGPSQKRALLLNPPMTVEQGRQHSPSTIVFITTPLHFRHVALEVDQDSILRSLIDTVSRSSKKLIVRVHPLERMMNYKNKIDKLLKDSSNDLEIIYSQYDNLDGLLSQAAAVVTFGSTVFLNCIKHQVPIIGFDWVDFGLKNDLKAYGIFYFSKNLADFSRLVNMACCGELNIDLDNSDHFLVDSSAEDIKSKIKWLTYHSQIELENAKAPV